MAGSSPSFHNEHVVSSAVGEPSPKKLGGDGQGGSHLHSKGFPPTPGTAVGKLWPTGQIWPATSLCNGL